MSSGLPSNPSPGAPTGEPFDGHASAESQRRPEAGTDDHDSRLHQGKGEWSGYPRPAAQAVTNAPRAAGVGSIGSSESALDSHLSLTLPGGPAHLQNPQVHQLRQPPVRTGSTSSNPSSAVARDRVAQSPRRPLALPTTGASGGARRHPELNGAGSNRGEQHNALDQGCDATSGGGGSNEVIWTATENVHGLADSSAAVSPSVLQSNEPTLPNERRAKPVDPDLEFLFEKSNPLTPLAANSSLESPGQGVLLSSTPNSAVPSQAREQGGRRVRKLSTASIVPAPLVLGLTLPTAGGGVRSVTPSAGLTGSAGGSGSIGGPSPRLAGHQLADEVATTTFADISLQEDHRVSRWDEGSGTLGRNNQVSGTDATKRSGSPHKSIGRQTEQVQAGGGGDGDGPGSWSAAFDQVGPGWVRLSLRDKYLVTAYLGLVALDVGDLALSFVYLSTYNSGCHALVSPLAAALGSRPGASLGTPLHLALGLFYVAVTATAFASAFLYDTLTRLLHALTVPIKASDGCDTWPASVKEQQWVSDPMDALAAQCRTEWELLGNGNMNQFKLLELAKLLLRDCPMTLVIVCNLGPHDNAWITFTKLCIAAFSLSRNTAHLGMIMTVHMVHWIRGCCCFFLRRKNGCARPTGKFPSTPAVVLDPLEKVAGPAVVTIEPLKLSEKASDSDQVGIREWSSNETLNEQLEAASKSPYECVTFHRTLLFLSLKAWLVLVLILTWLAYPALVLGYMPWLTPAIDLSGIRTVVGQAPWWETNSATSLGTWARSRSIHLAHSNLVSARIMALCAPPSPAAIMAANGDTSKIKDFCNPAACLQHYGTLTNYTAYSFDSKSVEVLPNAFVCGVKNIVTTPSPGTDPAAFNLSIPGMSVSASFYALLPCAAPIAQKVASSQAAGPPIFRLDTTTQWPQHLFLPYVTPNRSPSSLRRALVAVNRPVYGLAPLVAPYFDAVGTSALPRVQNGSSVILSVAPQPHQFMATDAIPPTLQCARRWIVSTGLYGNIDLEKAGLLTPDEINVVDQHYLFAIEVTQADMFSGPLRCAFDLMGAVQSSMAALGGRTRLAEMGRGMGRFLNNVWGTENNATLQ